METLNRKGFSFFPPKINSVVIFPFYFFGVFFSSKEKGSQQFNFFTMENKVYGAKIR